MDEEAISYLKQGATAWNEWRKKNRDRKFAFYWTELSNLNLGGADLSGVDFVGTDLSGSDFKGANFSTSNLSNADLSASDLKEATLSEANLRGVKFRRANLSWADLRDSDLSEADLSGALLIGADLSWAIIKDAVLCDTDFGKTKLLNQQDFVGASLVEAKLCGSDFSRADLTEVHLSGADLTEVVLNGAKLNHADLRGANFTEAQIVGADLSEANLSHANLADAALISSNLTGANLHFADLSCADLSEANLAFASLVGTNLEATNLSGCRIYGISAWDVVGAARSQSDLVITPDGEPAVTVDNLEVAQFVYLLLKNEKIRDVINTVGKKGVLILGRFTPERKAVLDAIRNELRRLNYVPILFDFERPTDKDLTETIMTLAGLSLFVVADITNPKSAPLELQATVPNYMTPLVPIIQKGEEPFSMFEGLQRKYDWVIDTLVYDSLASLMKGFKKAVVEPALEKRNELVRRKAENLPLRDISEYL